tara:strand:+ start:299 stop:580 length:282 start_codon:yes stop_codon:yes gene_type:complete
MLYSVEQPEPVRWRIGDELHLCTFIPIPHIEEQPEYEMDGYKVEGGLKEILHANYICGGFFDYHRTKAVVMLRKGEFVSFQTSHDTCTIKRTK